MNGTETIITRRTILTTAALLPFAGCANQTPDQLAQDVGLIAAGLSGVIAAAQPFAPPATLAQAQAAVATLQVNASQVAAALQAHTDPAQYVQNVAAGAQVIAQLLTPYLPQATGAAAAVQAALALVPVILAVIGRAPAAAVAGRMSPDQARAVLRGAR